MVSYAVSSLFYMGEWQGFGALASFNLFVARIAACQLYGLRAGADP
jgi:hypothetical protein